MSNARRLWLALILMGVVARIVIVMLPTPTFAQPGAEGDDARMEAAERWPLTDRETTTQPPGPTLTEMGKLW